MSGLLDDLARAVLQLRPLAPRSKGISLSALAYGELIPGTMERIVRWEPDFQSVPFVHVPDGTYLAPFPSEGRWRYRGLEWMPADGLCAIYQPL